MLKVVHLIQHLCVFSPFLVLALFSPYFHANSRVYVLVSQSARKICKFIFGSYNEVNIIC